MATEYSFTASETKLLVEILRHAESVTTEWSLVAAACGYKDASIAKTRWAQIRKRLAKSIDGTAPTASKKRGRGEDGGGGRTKGKKAKKIDEADQGHDGSEDEGEGIGGHGDYELKKEESD